MLVHINSFTRKVVVNRGELPTMTTFRKATKRDIKVLSIKLLTLLEDKNSQIYQENVAKFSIPDEYVKEAFAEETLLNAAASEKANFYLALDNNEIIGFAQTKQKGINTIIVKAGREETHARRFYQKNGFKKTSETTIEAPWGKKLTLITYQLRL